MAAPATARASAARARLRRDLRAGAHPRRLPPRAARAQPHLQCRRDRRRHARARSTPTAFAPPPPARPTSSPRPPSPAATCARLTPEQDARARARMQAIVAPASAQHQRRTGLRRGRLSADGADRGQSRPARPAQRREPRPRPCRKCRNIDPARRGAADSSASSPATSTRWRALARRAADTHAEGEWVDLDSLPRQAKRAAILITRLTRERR